MAWSIDMGGGESSSVILEEKAPTLCATHDREPAIAYLANGGGGDQVCPTLVGAHERMVSDYTALVLHEPMVQLQNNQNNAGIDDGKVAYTLTAGMGEGGGWTPMIAYAVHENQHATCTLNAVHPALTTGGASRGRVTRAYSFVNRGQWGDRTELAETIRSNCHGDYPCVVIAKETHDERT